MKISRQIISFAPAFIPIFQSPDGRGQRRVLGGGRGCVCCGDRERTKRHPIKLTAAQIGKLCERLPACLDRVEAATPPWNAVNLVWNNILPQCTSR